MMPQAKLAIRSGLIILWLAGCAVAGVLLGRLAVTPVDARAQATTRPNILLFIADDWSYPHAGAYGDKVVKTPNFDRIAREGTLFTNAYCASPSCTPSRASTANSPSARNSIERVCGRMAGMSLARNDSPRPRPKMSGLPPFFATTM